MDTLRTLAENTDGRAIVNRNDLATGMKQITRDQSAYYLIGYNSTQAPADGKFHEIKVRVKRSGVQVRARKGYWALNAEQTARALTPPKAALTNDGSLVFRGRVPDVAVASTAPASSVAAANASASPPRAGQRVVFDAAPGKVQLRVSVEGSSSAVLDTETREITVPDLTAPQ